jgi:ABC-type oligopeptide transport system ATPase subunit
MNASFSVNKAKTLAVVGESGCRKSTLARLVTMIERPTAGQFEINGMDGNAKDNDIRRNLRRHVQIVFELSPRQAAGNLHRKEKNRFSVRSLTPPQTAGLAFAVAVQDPYGSLHLRKRWGP